MPITSDVSMWSWWYCRHVWTVWEDYVVVHKPHVLAVCFETVMGVDVLTFGVLLKTVKNETSQGK